MDLEKFRSFMSDSGVDLWTWIDAAISVAAVDHEAELRNRRDGIVQKLYASSTCVNCERKCGKVENADHGRGREDDDDDDLEKEEILEIKNLLNDHAQSERGLIELLQRLVDMNTTFAALKETEIGRHVTKLRKHSSSEVRRLVKILVRKWKETVDEWVRKNTDVEEEEEEATDFNVCKDGMKDVSCYPNPSKRKAEDDGTEMSDQESQHAKKERRPQVMEISKLNRNKIVANNGGTVSLFLDS